MFSLTFPQILVFLNAVPQLVQMDAGIRLPYMNVAFAGVGKGGRPPEVPSFWRERASADEWREAALKKGLKHPE